MAAQLDDDCLLFTESAIFPWQNQGEYGTFNLAERTCGNIGAEIAGVSSQDEADVIIDIASTLSVSIKHSQTHQTPD